MWGQRLGVCCCGVPADLDLQNLLSLAVGCDHSHQLQRQGAHVLMDVAFPTATTVRGFLLADPMNARSTIWSPKSVSVDTQNESYCFQVAQVNPRPRI